MPGNSTVSSFILKLSVRAHKHRRHHGQGTEGSGDHIAHHVAVVVLACPDKSALRADHPCHGVIDQGVEIGNPGLFKGFFILVLIQFSEDILEPVVIGLADCVFGGEPQILLHAQCVLEAAVSKGGNGRVQVMQSLQHTGAFEFKDSLADFLSVFSGEYQFCLAGARHPHFRIFVHIAVRMTGNCDGLLPGPYRGMNAVNLDRGTEHCAVQDGTDRAVGALPHFLQVILLHPLGVGSNRGALDCNAVFQRRFRAVDRNLVVCFIPVLQSQVIILSFQVHKGLQQLFLYPRPEDPCHFVSVHLHQRCFHLYFAHHFVSFYQYKLFVCFLLILG